MVIGEKFSLCDFDVWRIQELTEPCKSCVLSCLIWMSLQHIQVKGLSMRRAFRAESVLEAVLTLIKTLTELTKKLFVGMTCQMDEESLSIEFGFLSNWLTDQLQYFQRQIVHWFLIWVLCKIHSNKNFLKRIFYTAFVSTMNNCALIWAVFLSIFYF